MKKSQLLTKVTELLESGAVVVTGADIKDGVAERIQVYFGAEGEAQVPDGTGFKRCQCPA